MELSIIIVSVELLVFIYNDYIIMFLFGENFHGESGKEATKYSFFGESLDFILSSNIINSE